MTIGFNGGDQESSLNVHVDSESLLDIESTSNVDIPGIYAFRVDQDVILQPGGKMEEWYHYYYQWHS